MDVWTFLWLMVFLKIPIVGLFMIVRWAVREPPQPGSEQDGGTGPRLHPHHPRHPRSRSPRTPRRGPHADPSPASPPRVRTVVGRRRLPRV